MRRFFLNGVLGAALGILVTGPAMADLVVVRTTAPALKAGQVVASGSKVNLPAGTSAVFLGQDGKAITINGPFDGVPKAGAAGGDPNVVASLSRLLTAGSGDTASLGVTRGALFDDPYGVNIATGVHCQVSGRPAVINRGKAVRMTRVTVSGTKGESTVNWGKDDATVNWPAAVGMEDGATYRLIRDDKPEPVSITVRVVPPSVKGDAAAAAWMGDHECRAQGLTIIGHMR